MDRRPPFPARFRRVHRFDVWSIGARTVFTAGLFAYVAFISIGLAHANVTETPRFHVPGILVVWHQDRVQVGNRIELAASGPADSENTFAGPLLGNGTLIDIPNKQTRLELRPIAAQGTTNHVTQTINIASNHAFQIEAHLAHIDPEFRGMDIHFDLDIGPDRPSAQYPHTTGQGFTQTAWSAADLSSPTTIFVGDQKTASAPGKPAQQAVTLTITLSSHVYSNTQLEEVSGALQLTLETL